MVLYKLFCIGRKDTELGQEESQKWTEIVDRGGFIHINDTFFNVLVSIELEVRRHFYIDTVSMTHQYSLKKIATESVLKNEDVLFSWEIVSVNWSSDTVKIKA